MEPFASRRSARAEQLSVFGEMLSALAEALSAFAERRCTRFDVVERLASRTPGFSRGGRLRVASGRSWPPFAVEESS